MQKCKAVDRFDRSRCTLRSARAGAHDCFRGPGLTKFLWTLLYPQISQITQMTYVRPLAQTLTLEAIECVNKLSLNNPPSWNLQFNEPSKRGRQKSLIRFSIAPKGAHDYS